MTEPSPLLDAAPDRPAPAWVEPAAFAAMVRPAAPPPPADAVVGKGLGVSPGTAHGVATFDTARAVERSGRGEPVVLVCAETRPEDLPALLAAAAVVTVRGGRTSHAAVVARSLGRPCIVGLADARLDPGRLSLGTATVADGDLITVDGSLGLLARGEWVGSPPPAATDAIQRLLATADAQRRMQVWANADTAADATAARAAGATGIGLCRTEHMFLGDRQRMLADVLLGPFDHTAQDILEEIHRMQRTDFEAVLSAMDGRPVTVRLLDPPRHEFLPDLTELAVQAAVRPDPAAQRRLRLVRRLAERNPMLGVRGVRLGVILPWLYEMQIAALLEATLARIAAGGDPRPRLLVPMVATAAELRLVRATAAHLLDGVRPLAARDIAVPVGVMIETPRAALIAAELAEAADFFSFGTNDLTQLTWGLSRDDTDAAVLRPYADLGLIEASPFERLDRDGVGQLIALAVRSGRRARPDLPIGVCGELAADPDAIQHFHDWGVDTVSCSVPDLAISRYAAGYAARPI